MTRPYRNAPLPEAVEKELSRWFPPRGPCGICGWHHDARHRLWDCLIDMHEGGEESPSKLASWYDLPLEAVKAVLRLRPYHKPRRAAERRKR